MYKLKEVIIAITNRCNSACRMCDIPKQELNELSTSCWKEVIKDASSIGASAVVFSGGEPLLRNDIFELISFVKKNNMGACITSNGLMINEKTASDLSNSGVDVVNVSIEGSKDTHDYLRGKETFEKVISALSNLKKYSIESTVATMVSRYNYKHLPYIVNLAMEYGATTMKFQPFNALFLKDKSKKSEFLISGEEKAGLVQAIGDVISLCGKYGINTNPIAYLEKIPAYLNKEFFYYNNACGALWTSCPINSIGEVYPCWALVRKDKLIGNITKKRLMGLWNSKNHNMIREKIKKEGCSGCMMSCYDNAFDKDGIERKITVNIGKLKKEGFGGYVKRIFRKWLKRFKFYASYRGSFKGIVRKGKVFLGKKRLPQTNSDKKEEIKKALIKIEEVKQLFIKKIRSSK